jgi:uncharacterized membrane protein
LFVTFAVTAFVLLTRGLLTMLTLLVTAILPICGLLIVRVMRSVAISRYKNLVEKSG